MTRRRVLFVENYLTGSRGLARQIDQQPDLVVCGETPDAASAARAVAVMKPEIVVMGIPRKGPTGIKSLADTPILVLSEHDELVYAKRVLRLGAKGYLMAQDGEAKLLCALRGILKGEVYVSDRVARMMLKQFAGARVSARYASVNDLSDQELEVFRLIGAGYETRRISEQLKVTGETVLAHQTNVQKKLGLKTTRALVLMAIQWTSDVDGPSDDFQVSLQDTRLTLVDSPHRNH